MKRIVTILITLVMCFAIAFPASAAVSMIELNDKIIARINDIDNATPKVPSDYKYKSVHLNGNTYDNIVSISIVYSNTEKISVGSIVYIKSLSINGGTVNTFYSAEKITDYAVRDFSGDSRLAAIAGTKVGGLKYYVPNLSTAYFYNVYTVDAGYDNIIYTCIYTFELEYLLSQAKAIQNIDYTPESWQALQSQIKNAENLLASTGYTQAQIDNAKNALQAAIDGLAVLPDTTNLEQLLIEADAIDDIGYTVPTWTRFDNARYSGHALIARQSYTQTEVTDTTTELSVSMNSLTLAPTSTPDPPKPPPSPLGYDLGTGDVSGYLKPVSGIFNNYVWSAWPIGIGIFAIVLSVVIIRRVLEIIIPTLRR